MVRIIIGTMDQIAMGRKSLSDVGRLLEEGSAKTRGLLLQLRAFLWQVQYDPLRWNITSTLLSPAISFLALKDRRRLP